MRGEWVGVMHNKEFSCWRTLRMEFSIRTKAEMVQGPNGPKLTKSESSQNGIRYRLMCVSCLMSIERELPCRPGIKFSWGF